jgi:hypothetical protein
MNSQPFNVVSYTFKAFLRSFLSFFSDWYIFIPRLYWKKVFLFFKDLDRSLGIKAMARNWFRPLYQDYNIAGLFIGIFIRTFWIIFGSIFYIIFFIIVSLMFLMWLSILPGLLLLAFINLF